MFGQQSLYLVLERRDLIAYMTVERRDLSHAPEQDYNHDKYKKYANGLQNLSIYQANVTPDGFWNLKVDRQNPAHRISKAHVAVASHWIMGVGPAPPAWSANEFGLRVVPTAKNHAPTIGTALTRSRLG